MFLVILAGGQGRQCCLSEKLKVGVQMQRDGANIIYQVKQTGAYRCSETYDKLVTVVLSAHFVDSLMQQSLTQLTEAIDPKRKGSGETYSIKCPS